MTATLPEPPQQYSFDCHSCRSVLSIPVALEGVEGPCPYCQAPLIAPPLIQSPEYAAYYYAHQQAMAEQSYAPTTPEWAPEASVIPDFTPIWETAAAPAQPYPAPATEAPVWNQPLAGAGPVDLSSFQVPITQPSPKPTLSAASATRLQRPFWLKVGLGAGMVGLAIGAYLTLRPKPQPVSSYQPPEHVPLTAEQAAKLISEQPPVAPVNPPPAAPAAANVGPAVEPPPAPTEIEVAPKALPSAAQPVPPVPRVIPEDEPTAQSAPPDQSPLASPELEQPTLLTEPRAALKAFLTAPNWKERAKFTQHADILEREMKDYYTEHADSPIKADAIDYLTSQPTPDGKSRFHLFQVECGEGYGFPVSVESMDGSFKVDWKSFVEFKDLQLPKYFEKYSSEPATFHAVLKRTHHFGSDVPNQENKICFAAEPPILGYENHVWVDKSNAALINKLGERAEFGFVSYPVISLRWVKEKDGSAYVTIYQIVADNWRTDAMLPQAASIR
jgi:hypothetical protein